MRTRWPAVGRTSGAAIAAAPRRGGSDVRTLTHLADVVGDGEHRRTMGRHDDGVAAAARAVSARHAGLGGGIGGGGGFIEKEDGAVEPRARASPVAAAGPATDPRRRAPDAGAHRRGGRPSRHRNLTPQAVSRSTSSPNSVDSAMVPGIRTAAAAARPAAPTTGAGRGRSRRRRRRARFHYSAGSGR